MHFPISHWRGVARRFPSAFPVVSSDFLKHKKDWVRHGFTTCNFSLILNGRGEYHRKGRVHPIVAPAVITQWPGEYLEYGPQEGETWTELYVTYDAKLWPRFLKARFIDPEKPVWPIQDLEKVNARVEEVSALARSKDPEPLADVFDRSCEQLILATLLPSSSKDPESTKWKKLMDELRRDFNKNISFEALAARQGFSDSTFRRRWAEHLPVPPARYVQELRMSEACRLLAETEKTVKEIARAVGFDNELYFSRRFHLEQGMPPREYRKVYRKQG